MNGIFNEDGHISSEGFAELVNGEPDEMTRYEISEHLDFCDLCIDRYSLLLSDEVFLAPPAEFSGSVMAKLHRRTIMILTGQAAKVCAAACLAIIIWCGGVFNGDLVAKGENFSEHISKRGTSFSQMVSGVSDTIGSWLNGLSIYSRGERIGTEK